MRNLSLFVLISFVAVSSVLGQTLYRQHSGTAERLNSIFFPVDDLHAFAVGDSATVFFTTDAGTTWNSDSEIVHFGFHGSLRGISLNDFSNGAFVGDSGRIFTLLQDEFRAVQLPEPKTIYAITFPSYDTAVLCGASGLCYKSVDSAKTWKKLTLPVLAQSLDYHSVDYFDDSTYWLVGARGVVLYTEDAGTTWQRIPVPTTKDLYSICFPDSTGAGWIVGDSTLLYTTDGGDDWKSVPTSARLRFVTGYDSLHGYAAGLSGTLLATHDLNDWSPLATGTIANFNGIDIPDSLYVCGDSGIIVSTLPNVSYFHLDTIDFGAASVHTSEGSNENIQNLSFAPLTIDTITLDSSEFMVKPFSTSFPLTIGGDQTVAVTIVFTPAYSGKVSSLLRVIASDGTTRTTVVSGEGVASQGVVSLPDAISPLTIFSNGHVWTLNVPMVITRHTDVTLFNVLGSPIISGTFTGGVFNAGPLVPGIYFYKISGMGTSSTGKLLAR